MAATAGGRRPAGSGRVLRSGRPERTPDGRRAARLGANHWRGCRHRDWADRRRRRAGHRQVGAGGCQLRPGAGSAEVVPRGVGPTGPGAMSQEVGHRGGGSGRWSRRLLLGRLRLHRRRCRRCGWRAAFAPASVVRAALGGPGGRPGGRRGRPEGRVRQGVGRRLWPGSGAGGAASGRPADAGVRCTGRVGSAWTEGGRHRRRRQVRGRVSSRPSVGADSGGAGAGSEWCVHRQVIGPRCHRGGYRAGVHAGSGGALSRRCTGDGCTAGATARPAGSARTAPTTPAAGAACHAPVVGVDRRRAVPLDRRTGTSGGSDQQWFHRGSAVCVGRGSAGVASPDPPEGAAASTT